jgi:hypothetical protein
LSFWSLLFFTLIGYFATVFLVLLPVDLLVLVGKGVRRVFAGKTDASRRRLLSDSVVHGAELTFLAGTGVTTISGLVSARVGPIVKDVRVSLGRALSFGELKIAQISDLHLVLHRWESQCLRTHII